jgi:hypothetical protein
VGGGRSGARSAPALACAPLRISLARVLRPLESPPRGLESFLHVWGSLPLQVGGRGRGGGGGGGMGGGGGV